MSRREFLKLFLLNLAALPFAALPNVPGPWRLDAGLRLDRGLHLDAGSSGTMYLPVVLR
jgi:hypothetical protein